MGSNISKTGNETAAQAQKNDLDKDIGGNPDPRSPTPEITRTPLQNKTGSKHNITKNVDLRKTFESNNGDTKLIHNNPILSAVIKNHLQSFDPRSPTQDFERTPIVINTKTDNLNGDHYICGVDNFGSPSLPNDSFVNNNDETLPKISPELIPKNLCNEFHDLSLDESLKNEEPLGSSTASNEALENHISKEEHRPTQLLETNFDYVEDEIQEYRETACDSNVKQEIDIKNNPLFKILNEDPRSPSVGIERTPIVVVNVENNSIENSIEEMSDDLLIKALQNTNVQMEPTIIDNKSSDGILIYEDESTALNDTPKKSKSASNSGSRTPLSCMRNKTDANHGRSKSANTLYDPKTQKVITKIPKRASHIPRLKSLSKQAKSVSRGSSISLKNSAISGDCENTPPQSHRDRWDKESSIVL
ncbi:uncharacterized protein LOC119829289 [Zerene cesonia]|uniref:uncharacterized protein LOC119829289 n=1 Tax=Zerene cesonia TaxID=33412 RepID=UPI0018E50E43|nr:uncharacterized protein LOC119829289 [Zerene cesonia]